MRQVQLADGWRRGVASLSLLGMSSVLLSGFAVARLLGVLFSILAARILLPAGFGDFAEVLAVATVTGFLVTSVPAALGERLALARASAGDPAGWQELRAAWLVLTPGACLVSLVGAALVGTALGLRGWLLAALLVNVLGPAVMAAYLEAERGSGREVPAVACYLAANLVQVLALVAAWEARVASAPLLLLMYGLSGIVLPVGFLLVWPRGERPGRRTGPPGRIWEVFRRRLRPKLRPKLRSTLRSMRPELVQSAFRAVWAVGDLILVARLLGNGPAGWYGAAKALSYLLLLAPTALGLLVVPNVEGAGPAGITRQVRQGTGLALAAALPTVGAAVAGQKLIVLLVGPAYEPAGKPLAILGLGFGLLCFHAVLSNVWTRLGRPHLVSIGAAAGMLGTIAGSLLLIPRWGLIGAAIGFTAGSFLQLAVLVVPAVRAGLLFDRPLLRS